MTVIRSHEGDVYTPEGHDATVRSRSLLKVKAGSGLLDCHVTSFGPGDGMAEEVHEGKDHLFFVLEGQIELLSEGKIIAVLDCNDSVYIPAGEKHQVANPLSCRSSFIAVTFPNVRS